MSERIAVADIGGTNARFALANIAAGGLVELGEAVTLPTDDYPGLPLAWRAFVARIDGDAPSALAVSFAGPVDAEGARLTNSPWRIARADICAELGIERFTLVNDFAAVAHAVAGFGEQWLHPLCGPDGPLPETGITSIVGPGTGLGVSQLRRHESGYEVLPTEGGHADFAAVDPVDDRILTFLRRRYRRVSVERVASGPGLANIHEALLATGAVGQAHADESSLWEAAREGRDALAAAALDRFFMALGSAAGDIALMHGANAVVIAGGVGFRLRDRFAHSGFADRFVAKGRFERRMSAIPVRLVTHPQPGLVGAATAFFREHR